MGGVAIATLAGDHIHRAGFRAIEPATVVTWIVASLWIPVLVMVSLRLRDGNWWAAVFPLGMYSSATFATAVETGWRPLATVALVFFWIALAAWLVVTGRECATLYARRGVSRTQLRGRRRDR
jgi:tellurite resistance protein TehA-like permease